MGFFDALKRGLSGGNKKDLQNPDLTNKVLQECSVRYNKMTAQFNQVYDAVLSQEQKIKYPFTQIMGQVDTYLQALLLGLSLSDNTVSNDEIYIIDRITKYGNVFRDAKIDMDKTDFNSAVMRQRIQAIGETCHTMIPVIFQIIAEIDKSAGSDLFAEVSPGFVELLCFFCATDGNITDDEKNKIRVLAEPLFQLFPNSKTKL